MTSRIKEIVNLYKFTFPMGWVDGFDWSQDRSAESLESVRDKVKMFEQETFFLFAQSVLSGEYLIKKDFNLELRELCIFSLICLRYRSQLQSGLFL